MTNGFRGWSRGRFVSVCVACRFPLVAPACPTCAAVRAPVTAWSTAPVDITPCPALSERRGCCCHGNDEIHSAAQKRYCRESNDTPSVNAFC
jgi:hypothetical protein